MADSFGLLELPASASDTPIGDPSLTKLGAYIQAVVNQRLGAAWLALRPRTDTNQQPVIRTVLTHDPEELCFNDRLLPALFLYRDNGRIDQLAEDWLTDTTEIRALWVYPPEPPEKQRPRNPFVNAVAKAIVDALDRGRDPAWVDAGDPDPYVDAVAEDIDSYLLSKATSTSTVTYSGATLDGVVGASEMSGRRGLVITTAAATTPLAGDPNAGDDPPAGGPYNITEPIIATFVDCLGTTRSRSLFLTSEFGPEAVRLDEDFSQLVSLAVPEQLGTNGAIQAGNPYREGFGSEILLRTQFEYVLVKTWKRAHITIEVFGDNEQIAEKATYQTCQLMLEARESRETDIDGAAEAGILYHPHESIRFDVTHDGFLASQAALPDQSA